MKYFYYFDTQNHILLLILFHIGDGPISRATMKHLFCH